MINLQPGIDALPHKRPSPFKLDEEGVPNSNLTYSTILNVHLLPREITES